MSFEKKREKPRSSPPCPGSRQTMGARANAAGSALGVFSIGANCGAAGAGSVGAGTVCAVVSGWSPVAGCSTRPKSLPPAKARTVSPRISIVPASVIPLDRTWVSGRDFGMRGTGREVPVLAPGPLEVDPALVLALALGRAGTGRGSRSETRPVAPLSSCHDQSSASSGRRACGLGKLSLRQSFMPVTRRAHHPPFRPRQVLHPGYTLK